MNIGDRIREFGVKTFGSVTVLAEKLDVSLQHLSPYLNSKYEPGTPMLLKLADLGCDINWLLQGKRGSGLVREKGIEYVALDDALKSDKMLFEFPIVADVPAGRSEIKHHDWPEYIKIDIDPREHFALRIDDEYGISMAPYIEPGDILFCSFTKKFNGKPVIDKEVWLNEVFKNDETYLNIAIGSGHVKYTAVWVLPKTKILLSLEGQEMKGFLSITYSSVLYEDLINSELDSNLKSGL